MTVIVKNREISVQYAEVSGTINEITRGFIISKTEAKPSLSIGDNVKIKHSNTMLLEGDIERIEVGAREGRKEVIYSGRNYARNLVESESESTIQFVSNLSISNVFGRIANDLGLKILGTFRLPSSVYPVIHAGSSYGKALMDIAWMSGQLVTSDAHGNIVILSDPKKDMTLSFEDGVNIRDRVYKSSKASMGDMYVVLSQSNPLFHSEQDVSVRGEYGSGKIRKVRLANTMLKKNECDKLAKVEYLKAKKRSFKYSIEVDIDTPIVLNTLYKVKDSFVGLEGTLNLKKFVYQFGVEISALWLDFERVENAS